MAIMKIKDDNGNWIGIPAVVGPAGPMGPGYFKNTVEGSGAVSFAVEADTDYTYTAVTSLNITGNTNEAHGFVTFGSSAPSVSVTGFLKSGGDDVAGAKASEVWEFSCDNGYIIWKNWSA